ncbi:hypothetical protein GCM10023215_47180 [Pseudonocardia yuanmonensis]|uniref:Phosphoribosyl transferase-like protein n=1 Tax=Pseudonocardia yuanmonensis TaxID=1095914 RepID=A0ABP8X8J2_9PSEU
MRLSLHRVKPVDDRLVTETGADFDELSYSRFKHGGGTQAERYGRQLASVLLATPAGIAGRGEPIVIASAPYKYLPTASHELALQILRVLNTVSVESGHPPAEIGKLSMSRVDRDNYAEHGVSRRRELLGKAGLTADAVAFAGRHVLLVDDARITGLAEETATDLLMAAGARTVTALYVLEIADGWGARRPDLEHRVNHAFVRNLTSLLEVYRSERFVLNIRTLKYVLGWPDHGELTAFFGRLTHAELNAIHEAALHTGPQFRRHYTEGLKRLRAALEQAAHA